jgi:hypothetical protein
LKKLLSGGVQQVRVVLARLHSCNGSWLNQAEIEVGLLSRQCLGTRRIPDLQTLQREVRAWNRHMNRCRIGINWQFSRKAARRKFGYKRK